MIHDMHLPALDFFFYHFLSQTRTIWNNVSCFLLLIFTILISSINKSMDVKSTTVTFRHTTIYGKLVVRCRCCCCHHRRHQLWCRLLIFVLLLLMFPISLSIYLPSKSMYDGWLRCTSKFEVCEQCCLKNIRSILYYSHYSTDLCV